MAQRHPSGTGSGVVVIGAEYDPEQVEFLVAVDRYKRRHRRPFPTLAELLDVARSLGWRKGGGATAIVGPEGSGLET